ncbi:putative Ulp1 protease family catalytic domain-containing protein [Sesbania bispinosa]|nr:putative Ulp1 protease family catalytic domain-containing protein [Sesbania bispinosa]
MTQMTQWVTRISGGTCATLHAYANSAILHAHAEPTTLHVHCRSTTLLVGMSTGRVVYYPHPCPLKLTGTHAGSGYPRVHVDIVQSHEEGSLLPVPIEDENLMTFRDAIGTYAIHLEPQIPRPSSKEKWKGISPHKGVHHFTSEGLRSSHYT